MFDFRSHLSDLLRQLQTSAPKEFRESIDTSIRVLKDLQKAVAISECPEIVQPFLDILHAPNADASALSVALYGLMKFCSYGALPADADRLIASSLDAQLRRASAPPLALLNMLQIVSLLLTRPRSADAVRDLLVLLVRIRSADPPQLSKPTEAAFKQVLLSLVDRASDPTAESFDLAHTLLALVLKDLGAILIGDETTWIPPALVDPPSALDALGLFVVQVGKEGLLLAESDVVRDRAVVLVTEIVEPIILKAAAQGFGGPGLIDLLAMYLNDVATVLRRVSEQVPLCRWVLHGSPPPSSPVPTVLLLQLFRRIATPPRGLLAHVLAPPPAPIPWIAAMSRAAMKASSSDAARTVMSAVLTHLHRVKDDLPSATLREAVNAVFPAALMAIDAGHGAIPPDTSHKTLPLLYVLFGIAAQTRHAWAMLSTLDSLTKMPEANRILLNVATESSATLTPACWCKVLPRLEQLATDAIANQGFNPLDALFGTSHYAPPEAALAISRALFDAAARDPRQVFAVVHAVQVFALNIARCPEFVDLLLAFGPSILEGTDPDAVPDAILESRCEAICSAVPLGIAAIRDDAASAARIARLTQLLADAHRRARYPIAARHIYRTLLALLQHHSQILPDRAWELVVALIADGLQALHADASPPHDDVERRGRAALILAATQAITQDHLNVFPARLIPQLVQVVADSTRGGARDDVNTQLTAVGLFWNLAERISQLVEAGAPATQPTWTALFQTIARRVLDREDGQPVRDSLIGTCFGLLSTYNQRFSGSQLGAIVDLAIAPMLAWASAQDTPANGAGARLHDSHATAADAVSRTQLVLLTNMTPHVRRFAVAVGPAFAHAFVEYATRAGRHFAGDANLVVAAVKGLRVVVHGAATTPQLQDAASAAWDALIAIAGTTTSPRAAIAVLDATQDVVGAEDRLLTVCRAILMPIASPDVPEHIKLVSSVHRQAFRAIFRVVAEEKHGQVLVQGLSGDTSTQDISNATPTQDISNATLTQDISNATPTQDISNATPTQNISDSTPTQNTTDAPPTQNISNATPTQNISNATPTQNISNAPPKHNISNAPPKHNLSQHLLKHNLSDAPPRREIPVSNPQQPPPNLPNFSGISLSADLFGAKAHFAAAPDDRGRELAAAIAEEALTVMLLGWQRAIADPNAYAVPRVLTIVGPALARALDEPTAARFATKIFGDAAKCTKLGPGAPRLLVDLAIGAIREPPARASHDLFQGLTELLIERHRELRDEIARLVDAMIANVERAAETPAGLTAAEGAIYRIYDILFNLVAIADGSLAMATEGATIEHARRVLRRFTRADRRSGGMPLLAAQIGQVTHLLAHVHRWVQSSAADPLHLYADLVDCLMSKEAHVNRLVIGILHQIGQRLGGGGGDQRGDQCGEAAETQN